MSFALNEDLLPRILGGDLAAWDMFLKKHRPTIRTWIEPRLGLYCLAKVEADGCLRDGLRQFVPPNDNRVGTNELAFLDWLRPFAETWADDRLVLRIRDGDEKAFAQWVVNHRGQLKDWADAEARQWPQIDTSGVTNDVLTYLLRHIRDFRGHTAQGFGGWVRQMIRNKVIDEIRKAKKLPEVLVGTDDSQFGSFSPGAQLAADISSASVHASNLRREVHMDLAKRTLEGAVEQLPDLQRSVARLKLLQGKQLKEIAVDLALSPPRPFDCTMTVLRFSARRRPNGSNRRLYTKPSPASPRKTGWSWN